MGSGGETGGSPMITGTIDVNQPRADSTPDPEPVVPLRKAAGARAPRPGQGTA
jgi:hypothetical protein